MDGRAGGSELPSGRIAATASPLLPARRERTAVSRIELEKLWHGMRAIDEKAVTPAHEAVALSSRSVHAQPLRLPTSSSPWH